MEDKIIELISQLSFEKDEILISNLCEKLKSIRDEKNKEKDLSYKYRFEKLTARDKAGLYAGLNKIVNNGYKNRRYEIALKMDEHIRLHYCSSKERCVQDCNLCPVAERAEFIQKTTQQHEKIKQGIINNLDTDFLMNKYLVNKIISKLNHLKTKK